MHTGFNGARHALNCHNAVDKCYKADYGCFMDWDHELDAVGLLCPLPILKARKRLQALESGQVLRLIADDPAAVIDVPHFCFEQGHELVSAKTEQSTHVYLIRKG